MDTLVVKRFSIKKILPSLSIEGNSKMKEFTPLGAISFLLEQASIDKEVKAFLPGLPFLLVYQLHFMFYFAA